MRRLLEQFRFLRKLAINVLYDTRQFARHSGAGALNHHRTRLRALITMDYHRIEKGLALPEPRPGFGRDRVDALVANLEEYSGRYGEDETVLVALGALRAYCDFNRSRDASDRSLEERVASLGRARGAGGVQEVTRDRILEAGRRDLSGFFAERYSVRQFAPGEVSPELIERAVRMAQKTPSVCNRQSSRVHVFSEPEARARVLEQQNGNRGFGHTADKVLVVTSEVGNFVSIGERNQCWIDGGMFAVSLVYALHSLGVGTCCLNCSNEEWRDRRLRRAADIPPSEAIITMIAVGRLPERLHVAQSPRRSSEEVLVAHGSG
jgi:nitroreductase